MDEKLLRQLVREHLLHELIQSKTPQSVAGVIVRFLQTKYGSALASMAPALFTVTLQAAATDMMKAKGLGGDPGMRDQIVRIADADLTRSGDSPTGKKERQARRAQRPGQPTPKKKPGMLGRMFGR